MALRILFVEKDLTVADLLVPSLERKGHQVVVARTQRQATSCIRTLCPNMLVMDVASFDRRGYDICQVIRNRLASVPTILLLAEGHDAAGSMAEAYMTPPFTTRKLLYRVKKTAELVVSREIKAGPLVLDPETRTLSNGQQRYRLRPKEAVLLELFMVNPGKTLSRRRIMKEVWDTDYVGDTRTLSVHVRWLRLKIEDDPGRPRLLRTVRGVGYRFDPRTA